MVTSVPTFCATRDGFLASFQKPLRLATLAVLFLITGCSPGSTDGQASSFTSEPTIGGSALQASPEDEQEQTSDEATDPVGSISQPPDPADDAGPVLQTAIRPDWLGTRVLPTIPGSGLVPPQTTPEELADRRFATINGLDTPAGDVFASTIGPVPVEVLARSTWEEGCPVTAEELSYLTMSFWGFDGVAHTGEMIVNGDVAEDITQVFGELFASRFPIEEMTVVSKKALDAEPTGDGNNTTAFVCRPVTGGTSFSQHAYGLAVDLNPFHNPYIRGELVLPELAGSYLDRSTRKTGMVLADGPAVAAFAGIGWSWGGEWQSLKDYQHFSLNNR